MTELEQLKETASILQTNVESINKRIKALEEKDQIYWFIGSDMRVYNSNAYEIPTQTKFNVFRTREEAEKERDIRQIWFELREFAKEWNADTSDAPLRILFGVYFVVKYDNIERILKDKFGDRLNLLNF